MINLKKKIILIKCILLIIPFISKGTEELNINKSEKIVFIGNSITEFWSTNFFKDNLQFINKGISGQTTPQILKRFDSDISIEKVKSVIILAGINDIAQNTGPITITEIANNIYKMCDIAISKNIKVIICSVLPANKFIWNLSIEPTYKVINLNFLLRNYCRKNNITYVDYYSQMVDWKGGLKTPEYTEEFDLVHPNKNGYQKMEEILSKYIK